LANALQVALDIEPIRVVLRAAAQLYFPIFIILVAMHLM
jgi:hypothetical protein